MTQDTLKLIGKLAKEHHQRDAIHVAVIPVEAAMSLLPGQRVGLNKEGKAVEEPRTGAIGVVDPWLQRMVGKGQRFWLLLNPATIESLRHVWTHPAFSEEPAKEIRHAPEKAESEEWLEEWCNCHDCPSWSVIQAGLLGENHDEHVHVQVDQGSLYVHGRECYGDIPGEFWDHVETVLGKKFPRARVFSCGC